jgi:hypothetical protein
MRTPRAESRSHFDFGPGCSRFANSTRLKEDGQRFLLLPALTEPTLQTSASIFFDNPSSGRRQHNTVAWCIAPRAGECACQRECKQSSGFAG